MIWVKYNLFVWAVFLLYFLNYYVYRDIGKDSNNIPGEERVLLFGMSNFGFRRLDVSCVETTPT
jgi:hypothetical protein